MDGEKIEETAAETNASQFSQVMKKDSKTPLLIVVLIVIIVILASIIFGPKAASMITKENTLTSAQLSETIDIDELSSAQFVYNGIAEKYKDNSSDIDFRVSYDATVKAGISMKEVTFEIDKEKKIVRPQLPEVEINDIEVDSGKISYMPTDPNTSLTEVLAICEQDAENESHNSATLKQTATENIQSIIEALTKPIIAPKGYKISWETE